MRVLSGRITAGLLICFFMTINSFLNIAIAQDRTENIDRETSDRQARGSAKGSQFTAIREEANQNTVTLVTAGSSDTEIRIALDLIDTLDNKSEQGGDKLRVLPILGPGGAQNALDVMFLRGVDIGITQTDTLAYLRGQDPLLYKDIYKSVHYISKLYNAEWHVVARKDIKDLSQLKGKKVNISKPLSDTYITSQNVFELTGTKVQYTTYDNPVALEKLRAGEIDAVVFMGGAPIDFVKNIRKEEGFHFVPVTFFYKDYFQVPFKNVLELFYFPATLKSEDYPNLIEEGKTVPTIANGVVLAVYNWQPNTPRHEKVTRFITAFFKKIDTFQQAGRHKKWAEINLSAKITEWQRFPVAEQLLGGAQKTPGSDTQELLKEGKNKDDKTYQQFLAFWNTTGNGDISQLSEESKAEMYQNFLKFIKKN